MLSPPEEKRPIMSARARRRLINSALTEHPVAQEIMRTYDAVQLFSGNMVQWLDSEGLTEEANLVKSVKPVILNKVTEFYVNLLKLKILHFLYPTTIFPLRHSLAPKPRAGPGCSKDGYRYPPDKTLSHTTTLSAG